MLDRPSVLIRHLITPQRRQPNDRGLNDHHDWVDPCVELSSCYAKKATHKKPRATKSWLPTPKKKPSAAPVVIRRAHSVHRLSDSVPLPLSRRSWSRATASLRNCEGQDDTFDTLARANRRAAPGPCLVQQGQNHQHSSEFMHSPGSGNGPLRPANDARLEKNLPRPPFLSLSDYSAARHVLQPTDTQATPNSQSPGGSSDSVDYLIRETDEAFKGVRSALRGARHASQDSVLLPSPLSQLGIPTFHKYSKSMPLPSSSYRHSREREDSSLSSSLRSSPNRRASVKKPQRKKTHHGGHRLGKSPIRTSRWLLSENVTDILTGQRFKPIEADEMLTPDRIEALRKKREEAQQLNEERLKQRYTSDTAQRVAPANSESDVEPFHLDGLAFRIGARAERNPATSLEAAPPIVAPELDVVQRNFSKQDGATEDDEFNKHVKGKEDAAAAKFPPTPLFSAEKPARFGVGPLRKPSSIPEIMVTTPDNTQLEPSTNRRYVDKTGLKAEGNEFFYLNSTPFTRTKPSFCHGPIVISKAEVSNDMMTMDDTLDWTALQMAILGGDGGLLQDISNEEDTKQAEEITSWFESFGFETYGALIPEDVRSMRSSSQSTLSSTPSTIDTGIDLPIPVEAEFPSGFWNIPAPGRAPDKAKFFNSTGLKRRVGEGRPRRPSSHNSIGSLPLSPTKPLVVHMGEGKGDITDMVPMGYNLGHDLGGFLKYKTEHVPHSTGGFDYVEALDFN